MSNISLNICWFWSPLSPVLFNVCTKGLADLNQNGPSKFLTLVDEGLIYKTSKGSQEATEAVQQQLDSVSQWCHDTGSLINPDKAQTLVHTWQQSSRQTSASRHRKHVETTAPKCKKGLSVLKAMAEKGIEQRHLFLLYQSVVLSVTDYELGLTTMSQTKLLKLDRVQNEAMRVILGTTKDTPTETMRFMLNLPPMQTRQKVEQVKAYFNSVKNPHNSMNYFNVCAQTQIHPHT